MSFSTGLPFGCQTGNDAKRFMAIGSAAILSYWYKSWREEDACKRKEEGCSSG